MKILIVSGFLGAGKTTFIKEMMKRCGREFVVLENEYGSTDVDQQLLKQEDSLEVWNLTEGCVCCQKSEDMISSVITIESTLSPEYLIVEPSGVGALSNVLRNLQKIQYERIRILRPVTILNANNFLQDYEQYGDVYQDQIKTAGIIAISQPEHPDSGVYDAVLSRVLEVNKSAELLPCHYTMMEDGWWKQLLSVEYDGKEAESVDESSLNMESFTIRNCSAASPLSLMWILQMALYGAFGQLIRAKGILKAGPAWLRFDIAGGQYSIVGLDEEEAVSAHSECVFIGHGIDRISLKNIMQDPENSGGIIRIALNPGKKLSKRSLLHCNAVSAETALSCVRPARRDPGRNDPD